MKLVKTKAGMSLAELATLQREQFRHDQHNHSDIVCLSKPDRLKHYGLHFAKYVGRLARGSHERIPIDRTITDTALVCLSAANVLHQRLDRGEVAGGSAASSLQVDPMRPLADAAGRFADACEKIDHLEDFITIAKVANTDILKWVVGMALERDLNLIEAVRIRRRELGDRQLFVVD